MSTFILGDTNAICDTCGFQFKGSELRKRWDNAMACNKCWEPRHPQDLIKPRSEKNNVKNARLEPEPRFLGINEIRPEDL